jgi:uncharacterized membrane protein
MRAIFFALALVVAIVALTPREAKAAMAYCNHTKNSLEAAVGYRDGTTWVSEGWWRIEPASCAHVIGKPLTQRFYFYYARALTSSSKDKPPTTWTGKYELCVDNKAFRIEGDENCEQRKFKTLGFQEIDIGPNTHEYKLDFKEGG